MVGESYYGCELYGGWTFAHEIFAIVGFYRWVHHVCSILWGKSLYYIPIIFHSIVN